MNTKKYTLTLLIGALCAVGAVNSVLAYDKNGYDRKGYDAEGYNRNSCDRNGVKKGEKVPDYTSHSPDSDVRGFADSKDNKDKQNVIVCHVPKGNPANKHTIHISSTAWPAHRDNHGGDYLGSCNTEIKKTTRVVIDPQTNQSISVTTNNLPSIAPEPVHAISGCTGEERKTLVSKLQSYYEPIIVNDDALDDKATLAAMSQCLNNGDSGDSGRGGHNDSHEQKAKVHSKEDSNKKKDDSHKSKQIHKRDSGKDSGHD